MGSVVVEQGDEGEMGVVERQSDDEVGVVGLGNGKEDTTVWGGFLRSKWPSWVVGGMSRICPGGWSGSGACILKIPQRRTCMEWELENGGRNDDSSLIPRLLPRSSLGKRL